MMSFLARLRMLFAVLLDKPIRVDGPLGAAHLFPREKLILPVMAGADDGDGDDTGGGTEDNDDSDAEGDDGSGDGDDGEEESDDDGGEAGGDDDLKAWKGQSRKHERRAKTEKRKREEVEERLKKREEADKSEQEKALDKAREEGRAAASTEAEKERRSDRLEVAVTRLANKPISIGEGDDAKKVRFADSDDALLYVERAISKGDIDDDEIFDDNGRVNTDALKTELAELLEAKPHFQADTAGASASSSGSKGKRANGDADQGKGEGAGKALDELSPEDHLKRIQKSRA